MQAGPPPPAPAQDERLQLSRSEWMQRYGTLHASEEWFESHQPRIMSQTTYRGEAEDRPWYKSVGRDHGKTPLWMRQQVGARQRGLGLVEVKP